jgi:hypothetical protein
MIRLIEIQSLSGLLPDSSSDTRSVLSPRPAARRVSAFTAFRKFFCNERKNIFRTFRKRRRLTLGAGHLHVAPRRGDPSTLRANPIPEKTAMNTVSLTGVIASTPTTATVRNGLTYTSFRLRVHAAYLGDGRDAYTYVDEHTIIAVGQLTDMLSILPRNEEISVGGELRTRIHVYRVGEPININLSYPFSEVVANSITWRDLIFKRTAGDDTLIALYRRDPQ